MSKIRGRNITLPSRGEAVEPLVVHRSTENKGWASFIRVIGNLLKMLILGPDPEITVR